MNSFHFLVLDLCTSDSTANRKCCSAFTHSHWPQSGSSVGCSNPTASCLPAAHKEQNKKHQTKTFHLCHVRSADAARVFIAGPTWSKQSFNHNKLHVLIVFNSPHITGPVEELGELEMEYSRDVRFKGPVCTILVLSSGEKTHCKQMLTCLFIMCSTMPVAVLSL